MNDLLDLASQHFENLSETDRLAGDLKRHQNMHYLYPPFFQRAEDLPDLEWNSVEFDSDHRADIPQEKGVYAFAIKLRNALLPPTSYILYVGKAGDLDSNNTLRKRYADYLREQRKQSRPAIHQMLCKWRDCLTYYYAVTPEDESTGRVEELLLDVLIPPFNKGDFRAELADVLRGENIR